MNKQEFLEETYNSAFEDEFEKIALSTNLLNRAGLAASKKMGLKGTLAIGPKKLTRQGAKVELDMLKLKRGTAGHRKEIKDLYNKKGNVTRSLERLELLQSQIK